MNNLTIYTDGSAKNNPGDGGWAFLIVDDKSSNMILSYGSVEKTTNNRMEMTAILNAIQRAKEIDDKSAITIYTDSKYVESTVNNGWIYKWIDDSFKDKKNIDLWVKLYGYLCSTNLTIKWVKGHCNNAYNELVDYYASTVAGSNTEISENLIKKE